ncbi:hypothetical protein EON65_36080 [archaeon]|nr:MAG: hypothetical protein EON65_36080 [archaeon]
MPGEIPIPSNIPRQKNDAVCINCLGVSFYDDALKKAGKKPVCYGIEYKAAVPVPANEMSVLETLPILQPQTKVYAIGMKHAFSFLALFSYYGYWYCTI